MVKSIFTKEYSLFLSRLRSVRKRSGLTQEQLAERLNLTQSIISKCERGERRIDVIELRAFCIALEISLPEFIQQIELDIQQAEQEMDI